MSEKVAIIGKLKEKKESKMNVKKNEENNGNDGNEKREKFSNLDSVEQKKNLIKTKTKYGSTSSTTTGNILLSNSNKLETTNSISNNNTNERKMIKMKTFGEEKLSGLLNKITTLKKINDETTGNNLSNNSLNFNHSINITKSDKYINDKKTNTSGSLEKEANLCFNQENSQANKLNSEKNNKKTFDSLQSNPHSRNNSQDYANEEENKIGKEHIYVDANKKANESKEKSPKKTVMFNSDSKELKEIRQNKVSPNKVNKHNLSASLNVSGGSSFVGSKINKSFSKNNPNSKEEVDKKAKINSNYSINFKYKSKDKEKEPVISLKKKVISSKVVNSKLKK